MKTIHFWNDTEQVINEDEAVQLKRAFDDGREYAEIGGHWFKLSAVADIFAGGVSQTNTLDKPTPPPQEPLIAGSLKDRLKEDNPELSKRLYG